MYLGAMHEGQRNGRWALQGCLRAKQETKWSDQGDHHWETAVTKKPVAFVPLYTLCGKVQNCTESLQVMYRVTKEYF